MSELKVKQVVAYVRVSNDLQDSDNQEQTIKRYAAKNEITILEWYMDNEGTNPRGDGQGRKEFQRMYQDAKAGKFNAVLVAYQKRLGLIGHWFSYWVVEFGNEGVSLYDAAGNNLSKTDPATMEKTARDTVASTEWLIEQGKKMLNARITSGENGDYHGASPPYYCDVVCYDASLTMIKHRLVYHSRTDKTQYLYNSKGELVDTRQYCGRNNHPKKNTNDRLRLAPTIQKERIRITQQVFQWFHSESINLSQIAGRLNTEKIPGYFKPYWTIHGVKSILRNPAVIGKPAQCKITSARYSERYEDGRVDEKETNLGEKHKPIRCKPVDWVMPEKCIYDPIVDPEVFWAAVAKLEKGKAWGQ